MTQPGEHLDDDTLSAAIDDRLTPDEASRARAHLETCEACGQRLAGLRSVVGLLRQLPSLEPPRRLFGPRLVADPPNVVRLRRVYTVARTGAAALAAVFVFASAGALYVGASPRATPLAAVESSQPTQVARPQLATAPPPQGPPAAAQSAPAVAQSAPAVPPKSAPAPAAQGPQAPAAAARASAPAPSPSASATTASADANQASAATSTPAFSMASAVALWTTAIVALLLAVLGALAAFVIRRRLQRATSTSPTE